MPLSVRPYPQILALLLCGLCSACGIMNNQFAADLVSPAEVNETTGLIILSVGAPESCSTGHFVQIQNFDKPYNATPRAYLSVTSYVFKSDFRDHHGHLYVVKLAPGKYYLAPRVTGPITYSTNPPRAEFELHANEITYLGEFYMPQACGLSTLMAFRDQEVRDMRVLKSKNPAFENFKITKRLLGFTGVVEWALWPF